MRELSLAYFYFHHSRDPLLGDLLPSFNVMSLIHLKLDCYTNTDRFLRASLQLGGSLKLRYLEIVEEEVSPQNHPEAFSSVLNDFQLCFRGLQHLYVMTSSYLMEDPIVYHALRINHHSQTLKNLMWHHKEQITGAVVAQTGCPNRWYQDKPLYLGRLKQKVQMAVWGLECVGICDSPFSLVNKS